MPGVVIDASVALSWLLPDEVETTRGGLIIDAVMARGAIAPGLWRLEVANGLLTAARRGRISSEAVEELLARAARLPIAIDGETTAQAWGTTIALAQAHGLTAYDAAYLELAKRAKLSLASDDQNLRKAATAEAVRLL
ncbi:MAG TPA: type II toxin-antitoxin system VapC family toxin [Caulobacteraceae bacterium]